jgi:hypothetical protein
LLASLRKTNEAGEMTEVISDLKLGRAKGRSIFRLKTEYTPIRVWDNGTNCNVLMVEVSIFISFL